MKRLLVVSLALLLSGCSAYKVYSVRDNPTMPIAGGVVYALPRTQLRVAVTVERRDLASAPYARFAADMLGATAADLDTSFRIVDIDVTPHNVADPDYYYFVKVRRGSLTVDDRHLLLAVGAPVPSSTGARVPPRASNQQPSANSQQPTANRQPSPLAYNLYDRPDTFYTRYDSPGHPSLVTTKKDVRTLKQRAEAAAASIDELQTRQRELLTGEADNQPDAESLRIILAQLRHQELQLKALFVGETHRETVVFYVDPALRKGEDFIDTISWFSPTEGFVTEPTNQPTNQPTNHSNIQAFPIVCTVQSENTLKTTNRFVRYHTSGTAPTVTSNRTGVAASKSRTKKAFRYRIPEQTTVTIFTPQFSLSRHLPISQFGPTVQLPTRRIKALFDPQTHDLRELKIEN